MKTKPPIRAKVIDRATATTRARIQAFDEFAIDATQRVVDSATGFVSVPGKISRTGVQAYLASELGLDGDPNRTVRLYRSADEVFAPGSLASFEHKPLTDGHPPTSDIDVKASNWRKYARGHVRNVKAAGDGVHVEALVVFEDESAIRALNAGKNQLSCGYSFTLDATPGVHEGQSCDGLMRDIVGNHVADVWNARGGSGLRVADEKPNKEKRMRTVTIDGTAVNFEDDNQGAMVELALKRAADAAKAANDSATAARAEVTAAGTALEAATKASTEAKAAHDAQVAELTAKVTALTVTPEQEQARIEERAKAVGDAKAIVGETFDAKGKTIAAIRVEALDHIIAKDAASPAGVAVKACLAGVEPGKATDAIATIAFNSAVAVLAAGGKSKAKDSKANDAAARAFAPDKAGAGDGKVRTIDYTAKKKTTGQASA